MEKDLVIFFSCYSIYNYSFPLEMIIDDIEDLIDLLEVVSPYVTSIKLRQLPSHISPHILISKLKHLASISIHYSFV